jgi:hypothetical protein
MAASQGASWRTPISWKEDTGGGDWEKPDKKDRTGIFVGFLVWWNSLFSCSPMEERVARSTALTTRQLESARKGNQNGVAL